MGDVISIFSRQVIDPDDIDPDTGDERCVYCGGELIWCPLNERFNHAASGDGFCESSDPLSTPAVPRPVPVRRRSDPPDAG